MRLKKFAATVLAAAMALSLAACGGSSSGDEAEVKDTIKLAANREPVSLDPADVTVTYATMIESNIYDCLLQYDTDLNIVGDLAESWEQLDPVTWKFNLKKGIKFHNGEEMTSHDVLFSFQRLYDMPTGSKYVVKIDPNGFETPDDYTFILRTTEPYVYLESYVTENTLSILNEKAVTEAGDSYGRNPVGTGPYRFVSWVAGDNITLERFDDYYGDAPLLKTVVCKFISENSARAINLENGDVDFVMDLQESDFNRIAEGEETKGFAGESTSLRYFGFNTQHAPLDNVNVRKALIMAIDLESIRESFYPLAAPSDWTVVPPALQDRLTDLEPLPYDPEEAKRILAEEGYGDGFTVNYIYLAGTTNNSVASALQADWAKIGVTLNATPLESGELSTAMNKGEQDACCAGTGLGLQAGEGLYNLIHTDSIGGTSNRTYLQSPEVDAIIDEILVEEDPVVRGEKIKEAQRIIHDLYPMAIIGYTSVLVGMRKDVQGFEYTPTQRYDLGKLYFGEE